MFVAVGSKNVCYLIEIILVPNLAFVMVSMKEVEDLGTMPINVAHGSGGVLFDLFVSM